MLVEGVYPETPQGGQGEGEVTVGSGGVTAVQGAGHDGMEGLLQLRGLQRLQVDAADGAVDPQQGRQTSTKMQIGSLISDGKCQ
ncbi:hypothetical protein J2S30_002687 [Herbaspirillum rubrisubalbicans]|nr:hypothetical protein [Herbaspirillum rubrisubalbicans]